MCSRVLSFIARVYPFNPKIERSLFLKLNLFLTIILSMLVLSDFLSSELKIIIVPVALLVASPIGIYQYVNSEDPSGIHSCIILAAEAFLAIICVVIVGEVYVL